MRWFQALLLLAPLLGTGLHVPYHLIVLAQLGASLLSMHIFVHSSRFEAHDDAGHTPAEGSFSPAFYANASSQRPFDKPSTSSSTRVTLCVTAPPICTDRAAKPAHRLSTPHGMCMHVCRPITQPVRGCHVLSLLASQVPAHPHGTLAGPRRLLQVRAVDWIR